MEFSSLGQPSKIFSRERKLGIKNIRSFIVSWTAEGLGVSSSVTQNPKLHRYGHPVFANNHVTLFFTLFSDWVNQGTTTGLGRACRAAQGTAERPGGPAQRNALGRFPWRLETHCDEGTGGSLPRVMDHSAKQWV